MASACCAVCGAPFSGLGAAVLSWRGIKRSPRNPNVCTRCGAHLEEGALVELTVLFADLSSFTSMTSRLGAEKTYTVVDAYLRAAAAVVAGQGGTVDKFIGDAVMAFFNAPVKRPDHGAAAVAAAEALQREMPALSERLGVKLQVSVGIALGYARVGRLGSDDPKDYSAIGDCVNQAARLQAQAKAGEILVSDGVYAQVASAYPGVAAERLSLKGFSEACLGYRLKGETSAAIASDGFSEGRPAMSWSAVILALLGSGCLGKTAALAALLAYGGGFAASLTALAAFMDGGPLRTPVLAGASALSAVLLFSLYREWRQRKECLARHTCLEMTQAERRRVRRAALFAAVSLGLVGFELLAHRFDVGMRLRRSAAQRTAELIK